MADDEAALGEGLGAEEMGDPIGELADFVTEPPQGFVFRLLNALRRRDLSSHLATLGWTGLGEVFLEFVKVIYSLFDTGPADRQEGTDADPSA
ncbi:MAG: hypothetical protein OEN56_00685 [Gemmatimonadota bacterium]|nr:hypothetical protein [Gemmatimonadota bacterium]